ncbi:MAG: S8 family serine peptidase [Lachnospira sp.]|nr:S8 family serine peptidase [Lachnospira sp.]
MPNCIIDENYLDIIVENELLDLYSGHPVTYINNKVSEVHIMIDKYDPCLLGRYHYHSLPTCYTVEANVDFDTTGVSQVQNNPYFALYGNQVLVGIVDTGIEYTHEAFLDSTGKSRIATIWDQTVIDESRQPERFGYGAVYEKDDIDRALQAENPYDVVPVRDYHGHGTTIAGIIAGSVNAEKNFTGIVAMILEWAIVRGNYDSMKGNDIKKLLIRGAKRDVGMEALQYPNNIWGYGKINIYELFDKIR